MFTGTTDEYASLEARNRIKAERDLKNDVRDLIYKILSYGAAPQVENHAISFLKEHPEYWKQRIVNDTVYCKWIGGNGFEYYLGIGPETKCPVCGHKGKHHVHHDKKSWCRECTRLWKANKKKVS